MGKKDPFKAWEKGASHSPFSPCKQIFFKTEVQI